MPQYTVGTHRTPTWEMAEDDEDVKVRQVATGCQDPGPKAGLVAPSAHIAGILKPGRSDHLGILRKESNDFSWPPRMQRNCRAIWREANSLE